jgi:HEAT repeat protein
MLALSFAAVGRATVLVDPEEEVLQAIKDLRSESARTRYWGTVKLERYSEFAGDAVALLMEALDDPDAQVRFGAARALEKVGPRVPDRDIALALMQRLQDPSIEVRAAAGFAIAALGISIPEMIPYLDAGLVADSEYFRIASALALVSCFPEHAAATFDPGKIAETAAATLRRILSTEGKREENREASFDASPASWAGRLGAAVALLNAELGAALLPELASRYQEGSLVALSIARSVAPYMQDERGLQLSDPEYSSFAERERAVLLAGMLGIADRATLATLVHLLSSEDELAGASATALRLLGGAARSIAPAIIEAVMRSSDPEIRELAGRALIHIDLGSAEDLVELVRPSDPELASLLAREIVFSQL